LPKKFGDPLWATANGAKLVQSEGVSQLKLTNGSLKWMSVGFRGVIIQDGHIVPPLEAKGYSPEGK